MFAASIHKTTIPELPDTAVVDKDRPLRPIVGLHLVLKARGGIDLCAVGGRRAQQQQRYQQADYYQEKRSGILLEHDVFSFANQIGPHGPAVEKPPKSYLQHGL